MTKTSRSNHPTTAVRIIAGAYRRRLVYLIDADGLRPTPDRVRETLFNWLADSLPNANVLDCCAGSGVLGFEALSRGASHVTMIEPNRDQRTQLIRTQQSLNIANEQLTLHQGKAEDLITQLSHPVFDIVFIDPPYTQSLWQPILQALWTSRCLSAQSLVYIEANQPHATVLGEAWLSRLTVVKEKKMGQIYTVLYHPILVNS